MGSPIFMDPHPSQHNAGLQHVVSQLQHEVTRPWARFKLFCQRSRRWMGSNQVPTYLSKSVRWSWGAWIAKWSFALNDFWTVVHCAMGHEFAHQWWQTLYWTPAQHLRLFMISIWSDTIICLSNLSLNCETENWKKKNLNSSYVILWLRIVKKWTCRCSWQKIGRGMFKPCFGSGYFLLQLSIGMMEACMLLAGVRVHEHWWPQ